MNNDYYITWGNEMVTLNGIIGSSENQFEIIVILLQYCIAWFMLILIALTGTTLELYFTIRVFHKNEHSGQSYKQFTLVNGVFSSQVRL